MTSPYAPVPDYLRPRTIYPNAAAIWKQLSQSERDKFLALSAARERSGEGRGNEDALLPEMTPDRLITLEAKVAAEAKERKREGKTRAFDSRNVNTMAHQMDQVKRVIRSPTARVQFFTLLKQLFNANCNDISYSSKERETLNLLVGEWQSQYPVTKPLFATVLGPKWNKEDCAATLRHFPSENVRSTTTVKPAAQNGFDGWW